MYEKSCTLSRDRFVTRCLFSEKAICSFFSTSTQRFPTCINSPGTNPMHKFKQYTAEKYSQILNVAHFAIVTSLHTIL